jgi:predicted dehydrogenase
VLRALAAGKRVFVEKPLADTIDDLTGIVEANSAARGKVMVDT